jgi:hypothetical protein
LDAHVRSVAGPLGPVGQIAAVKDLLDQNAITQDELEKLKANALAG